MLHASFWCFRTSELMYIFLRHQQGFWSKLEIKLGIQWVNIIMYVVQNTNSNIHTYTSTCTHTSKLKYLLTQEKVQNIM